MESFVFAAVLFAAACHAGWNATIKRSLDPLATTVLISIGAAVVAAALLPVVGVPAAAAWPWCIASVLIHLFYFAALIESYRAGDMGQVYPIARGSAPLLTRPPPPCSSASGSARSAGAGSSSSSPGSCCCRCAAAAISPASTAAPWVLPCSRQSPSAPIRWSTASAPALPAAPTP